MATLGSGRPQQQVEEGGAPPRRHGRGKARDDAGQDGRNRGMGHWLNPSRCGCPFARGGRVLVRFRANGYSLFARRSGEPLARLRLTGNGDEVVLLYPRTAVAGVRSATSAQVPCRSTKRSSASVIIHISWNYAKPTVEP